MYAWILAFDLFLHSCTTSEPIPQQEKIHILNYFLTIRTTDGHDQMLGISDHIAMFKCRYDYLVFALREITKLSGMKFFSDILTMF